MCVCVYACVFCKKLITNTQANKHTHTHTYICVSVREKEFVCEGGGGVKLISDFKKRIFVPAQGHAKSCYAPCPLGILANMPCFALYNLASPM